MRFLLLATLPTLLWADSESLNCPLRAIGLEYAQMLQPFRPNQVFQEIADALNGSPEAQNCSIKPRNLANDDSSEARHRVVFAPLPSKNSFSIYADPIDGSDDSGDGSEKDPFLTIQRALAAVREARWEKSSLGTEEIATIVLRKGTFHLREAIKMSAKDSFVTLQAYPGEQVEVSGSIPVTNVEWKPTEAPPRLPYEYRVGVLADGFDVADGGMYTLEEATTICTRIPECAGFAYNSSSKEPKGKVAVISFKSAVFYSPPGKKVNNSYICIKNYGYLPGVAQNLFVANLTGLGFNPETLQGLRVGGKRAIRARYPNAKSVEQLESMQILADSWTPQPMGKNPDYTFNPPQPLRNDTVQDFFQTYKLGVGGPCAQRFTPKAAYWCANNTQGGGPGPYSAPVGMTVSGSDEGLAHLSSYKHYENGHSSSAIVHSWRYGRWFSWAFEVAKFHHDKAANTATFEFSLENGGNQGSRGGDKGQEWMIENLLDELDSPGEFYFDPATSLLYLWRNDTAASSSSSSSSSAVVATQTPILINATGTSKSKPVRNVSMLGITFRDTAPHFMMPHGTPSGGDWAVSRMAALFFENTENVVLEGNLLTSIDGNGVFFSGYTRGAVVSKNEMVSIGETAILQWGFTSGSPVPGMGYDARNGLQPRGTRVVQNLVHEVGLWTKQNSFYFQAQSFGNVIEGNIAFNGPRAGINFNDGLGGGNAVTKNVIFNFCRESSDHGPFNSWDRQVYVYDGDEDGEDGAGGAGGAAGTVMKRNDTISFNWILANYHSSMAIDNDDGSCYYDTHDNVLINAAFGTAFGGYSLKSDFGGHSNYHHGNLDLFYSSGYQNSGQIDGHAIGYYDNYLYMASDGNYGNKQACKGQVGETIVGGNTVWSPTGNVTECGMPLSAYQKEGGDIGTISAPYPSDETVLKLARKVLRMDQKDDEKMMLR